MRSKLLYLSLLLLLAAGCASGKRVQTVPVRTEVVERLVPVPLRGDSSTIRLALDWQTNTIREVAHAGRTPAIEWTQEDPDNLVVTAKTPTDTVYLPSQVITRELPVEVEVTREVNRLHPWQQILMYAGLVELIRLITLLYKLFFRMIPTK